MSEGRDNLNPDVWREVGEVFSTSPVKKGRGFFLERPNVKQKQTKRVII